MNDEQFEQEQLDRDNAYKQALARVEAELKATDQKLLAKTGAHEFVKHGVNRLVAERDAAQAQLAEAVGLLWFIQGYLEEGQDSHVKSKIRSFISRHRLDEHAQAEQQEAQGAQAGDERAKFLTDEAYWVSQVLEDIGGMESSWIEEDEVELQLEDDDGNSTICTVSITEFSRRAASLIRELQARAALATQPAVPASLEAMSFEYAHLSGERRTVSITREDVIEGMEDALYEKLSDQICRCEPIGETNVVECNCQDYVEEFALVAAPPAAAHGDEAVRKMVLPERIDRRQYLGGRGDAVAQGWNDCLNWIDKANAMRAQGDGEVQ